MFKLGANKTFTACSRNPEERAAEHCYLLGVTSFQNNKPVKCMRMNSAVVPSVSQMDRDPVCSKLPHSTDILKSRNCFDFLQSLCFLSSCPLSFPSTVEVGGGCGPVSLPFSGILKSQHFRWPQIIWHLNLPESRVCTPFRVIHG